MEDKYLLCDITGPYSRIEYGKKGDKVIHLGTQNEFELVELNGERFHVRKENISETPVETEIKSEPEVKKEKTVIKQHSKPGRAKKQVTPDKQINLF